MQGAKALKMPDKIQLNFFRQERIKSAVAQAASCTLSQLRWQPQRPLPQLERRQVELELELARQRLEWQQPCGVARKSLYSSPDLFLLGEFYFKAVYINFLTLK